MAVYQAPNILDRVATGDDLYTITDSGGKKKLTPSPTEVSEPGTEINKALLQPMADALQEASEDLIPYNDYWWRIRQAAGSHSLKIVPFGQISGAYTYISSNDYYFISITYTRSATSSNPAWDGTITLQYASSVALDSAGNVILVNPTSITVNGDNVQSYASTLNGKYVKGLYEEENLIYKINTAGMTKRSENWSAGASGEVETYTYYGYSASSLTSTIVQVAASVYSESSSGFSYVSNADENFYPHSGTSGGVEYQYLGKIFDVAVKAEPYTMQTVNITSASWSNGTCTVEIPYSRYMLWWGYTSDVQNGGSVMVDNGKCYGTYGYEYYSTNNARERYEYHAAGATSISMGNQPNITKIDFSTAGLTLTGSGSSTLYYLPL